MPFAISGLGVLILTLLYERQTYIIVYILGMFISVAMLGLNDDQKDS